MPVSKAHRRAQKKAAGQKGQVEKTLKSGARIDAVTQAKATDLERSIGVPLGPFEVKPTVWRFGAGNDFLIQINTDIRKKVKVGNHCFVVCSGPDRIAGNNRAVLAKVAVDDGLPPDQIRLDATLRAALLIKEGSHVCLYRTTGGALSRRMLEALFKPKKLWAYTLRSIPLFMEKGLCGIEESTGRILGLGPRDQLRVEYVFFDEGQFKVGVASPTAFELSAQQTEQATSEIPGIIKNYPERSGLPIIRVDKDTRLALANEYLGRWKKRNLGTLSPPRDLPDLASVRLSVSLPFFLQTRATFYAASLFLGLPGAVVALAQLSPTAAIIGGTLGGLVLLPLMILWDIRRIRRRVR